MKFEDGIYQASLDDRIIAGHAATDEDLAQLKSEIELKVLLDFRTAWWLVEQLIEARSDLASWHALDAEASLGASEVARECDTLKARLNAVLAVISTIIKSDNDPSKGNFSTNPYRQGFADGTNATLSKIRAIVVGGKTC